MRSIYRHYCESGGKERKLTGICTCLFGGQRVNVPTPTLQYSMSIIASFSQLNSRVCKVSLVVLTAQLGRRCL